METSRGHGGAVARLAVVHSVTDVGLLPLAPDDTLREILERVRAGLDASAATILLLEGVDQVLAVRPSAGLQGEVTAGVRVPMGAGIVGRVAATGQPA